MSIKFRFVAAIIAAVCLAAGAIAIAEPGKQSEAKAAKDDGELKFQLPPGWTQADMEKCLLAGTPGKAQQRLASEKGEWIGKTTMWMGPDGPPMESKCVCTVTPIMDGRYTMVEMNGEMPGMGPYKGQGLHGFDNVTQKYVSTWIDNQSTGIAVGEGEVSQDGKVMTWHITFNCPLTGKPAKMRQIETTKGDGSKTLVMYGPEPKSGKEYKMMSIELTRK